MKNSLRANAILNAIKQLCAIIFPLISFAYCSRVLGSNGIGIYSFSQSIVSYFLLISKLGIPEYAIREGAASKTDKEKLDTFINDVFTINVITTVVAYLLLIATVLFVPRLNSYAIFIALQSISILFTLIGTDWINTIYEDYRYLTIRYIVIQVVALIAMFLFVRNENSVVVYCVIVMLSGYAGNLFNLVYLRKKGIRPKIKFSRNYKKHLVPIFILFFNNVASVIYLNSDITMLGFLSSDSEVGIYTISTKLYTVIKSLINALVLVTVPRFSYYLANGMKDEYSKKLSSVFDYLILFILPISSGLFLECDRVLYYFAGSEYVQGTQVVQILSVGLVFSVLACFNSYSILMPNRKEGKFLLATSVAAIVNIILNLFFIPKFGMNGAAITTFIAELSVLVITALSAIKYGRFKVNKRNVISSFIGAVCVVLICITFRTYLSHNLLNLIIEVIVCAVVYFGALFIMKNECIRDLTDKVLRKSKRGGK